MSNTIQPITPAPVAKKPLTKKQKAAIATGAVATTVALGSAVAAYALGKSAYKAAGMDSKFFEKIKAGYEIIYAVGKSLISEGWHKLTGLFKKGSEEVADVVTDAEDVVADAAEAVAE